MKLQTTFCMAANSINSDRGSSSDLGQYYLQYKLSNYISKRQSRQHCLEWQEKSLYYTTTLTPFSVYINLYFFFILILQALHHVIILAAT